MKPQMSPLSDPSTSELATRVAAAAATARRRRLGTPDVATAVTLVGEMVMLFGRDPSAYTLVVTEVPGLSGWLWQLALAVAAAGWPGHGLALLDCLPGVVHCAAARDVLVTAVARAAESLAATASLENAPIFAVGGGR
jgi:hypothetical protein